jgi:hypothetical protein
MATTDSTIAIIRDAWMDWGLSITTIKKGSTFFTGQTYPMSGFDAEALLSRDSLWLSHSAYYAALYGYRTSDPSRSRRCLFKLSIAEDIELVQFPAGLHPADVFKVIPGPRNTGWRKDMTTADMPPDYFVSKYWARIVDGTPFEGCIGHCRDAAPQDADTYGATPGSLIEAWLSKGAALRVEQCTHMSDDLSEFLARHRGDKQGVAAATFDQSADETYSGRE